MSSSPNLISPFARAFLILSIIFSLFAFYLSLDRPTIVPLESAVPNVLRSLPDFLALPHDDVSYWLPTVGVLAICTCLRWIPSTNLTRLIVRSILAVLTIRYLVWRLTSTLNFHDILGTTFSVVYLLFEATSMLTFLLFLFQSTWTTDKLRRKQADKYEQNVNSGAYLPSVDVFIPTYKEPEYIVRRTVIGCQAMKYPNKTIYILDDTRRQHIKELAEELGCKYITRPDNKHAKAGNLNNALKYTSGELITIMDADFVPFKNFLNRTVGFFINPEFDLIQTPQFFYNPDYQARNLGLEHVLPNDLENFFGYIQPSRDSANSVICCGTSYVVRRSTIEAIGGYYTRCCVEDFQTSLRMLTHGARLIYLNEILSMGESTRTFSDFIDQRLRWLQGNLQVYYCGDDLPIWSKFNWIQKSYVVNQLFYCFNPVFRAFFLIAPLITLYVGILPIIATVNEYIYYALPFTVLNIISFSWACDYRLSFLWDEVYNTTFCFPALQRLLLVVCNPFAKASTATRKGVKAEYKNYNFHISWQLIIILSLSIFGLFIHLGATFSKLWAAEQSEFQGKEIMIFWIIYNTLIVAASILSGIDQPVRRQEDRFPLEKACKIYIDGETYDGYTSNISESGAKIVVNKPENIINQSTLIEFIEDNFSMEAKVIRYSRKNKYLEVVVNFQNVSLIQNRYLVEMLYCNLNWWKQRKKPGFTDSFLALMTAILTLRPIRNLYKTQ
jgi:cellulose synthase (UDP-forming)